MINEKKLERVKKKFSSTYQISKFKCLQIFFFARLTKQPVGIDHKNMC